MEVGLALPQYDWGGAGSDPLPWSTVVAWAQRAEALGFSSIWVADHLWLPPERYGAAPGRAFGLDPLVALGALAAVTESVSVGTLVLCAGFRPPTLVAKTLAGIDVMARGRLIAGFGAGWHAPEYADAGLRFGSPGERLAQLAETLDVVRATWMGSPGAPPCIPKPAQHPHPPLWVGGKGNRLLRLVAERADGWNTVWTWDIAAYEERVRVLARACERVGRDPGTVTRSVGLSTLIGEDERDLGRRFERLSEVLPPGFAPGSLDDFRAGHLVGTVEQVREQLAGWAATGVAAMIVGLGPVPFSSTDLDDLDLVAAATDLGAT